MSVRREYFVSRDAHDARSHGEMVEAWSICAHVSQRMWKHERHAFFSRDSMLLHVK